MRRAKRKCLCGSGYSFESCPDRARGIARCYDCGEPFHPRSNAHVRCGSAETRTGCSGRRRRELDARRKRAARIREREQLPVEIVEVDPLLVL